VAAARSAKTTAPPQRILTDPRAIRALAHPARLTVLDALGDGGELTATACAELAGITPSAMSYHLRALEKWGFVERAASSGDARERPWRALGDWRIDAMADAATAAATSALTKVAFDRLAGDLSRWFAREPQQPAEWREVTSVANQSRWLTVDEAQELEHLYQGFLDARRGRTAADHPPGARRVRVTRVLVPLQVD
jgi:DNA-binding transcriptional ArsR family regulator